MDWLLPVILAVGLLVTFQDFAPRTATSPSVEQSRENRRTRTAGKARAVPQGRVTLELLESVPVETNWDTSARQAGDVWIEMFDGARHTIDMAWFYIANKEGEALEPCLQALERAADRGVQIRILAEKQMEEESRPTLERLGRKATVQWAWFDIEKVTGGILHAKFFVVDGKEAFVGSQNFDWRALTHIHELGMLIKGRSFAQALLSVFEADWCAMNQGAGCYKQKGVDTDGDGLTDERDPEPEIPLWQARTGETTSYVYPVFSPPSLTPEGHRGSLVVLLQLLSGAEKSLDIQLMTYDVLGYEGGEWRVIDDAIRAAAARGVKVRMNLSDWSTGEKRIQALKQLTVLPNIEVRINSIPQWSGGHIPYSRVDHAKYMVVDGKVGWLGTSNWGRGYFETVRSVEVVFRNAPVLAQLQAIFEQGWSGPYAQPLDPDKVYVPPKRDSNL